MLVVKMSKQELTDAIEKTIKEAREYRISNPEDATTIVAMDDYRRFQETSLGNHQEPFRRIVCSIGGLLSYPLAPLIIAGGLLYLGGREIYERVIKRSED